MPLEEESKAAFQPCYKGQPRQEEDLGEKFFDYNRQKNFQVMICVLEKQFFLSIRDPFSFVYENTERTAFTPSCLLTII